MSQTEVGKELLIGMFSFKTEGRDTWEPEVRGFVCADYGNIYTYAHWTTQCKATQSL